MGKANSEEHLTTITGPQAQAILDWIKYGFDCEFTDKSVPGLAVVELWRKSE